MTNPSYMNIQFESLQQAQDDLMVAYRAVQSTVDNLERELQSSLDQWSGAAKDAYWQVKRQWDAAIAHMAAVLNQAQLHLASAQDTYRAVEAQNTGIWG